MRIVEDMLKVGEPIDFNVYDKNGKLLLSKGIIPYSQEKVNRLLEVECYTSPYGEHHADY